MSTPSITPQAIGAFLILLATNLLILLGLDIGANREAALDTILNGVAVVGFLVHDAIVRHGRSKVAAALVHDALDRDLSGISAKEGNN